MPRAKKTVGDAKAGPEKAIRDLWNKIPIKGLYDFIKEKNPEGKWAFTQSGIKGCCLWHEEDSASFSLSFDKKIGKCFGCGKIVFDIPHFISKLTGMDKNLTLSELISVFKLEGVITPEVQNTYKMMNNVAEMKKEAAIAFNDVITRIYDAGGVAPEGYEYCQEAYDYLVNERKLNPQHTPSMPVGILLKPVHAKAYIKSEYHIEYDQYFNNPDYIGWVGTIIFSYNDKPDSIARFKLRKPLVTGEKNIIAVADKYTQELGLFGVFAYRESLIRDKDVYVTEGEFDVLSVMNAQRQEGRASFSILGTGGGSSTDLSMLHKFGITTVYLIPDSPVKNGDRWAKIVLRTKENNSLEAPLLMMIYNWRHRLTGADLDELVQTNDFDKIEDQLYGRANYNFSTVIDYTLGRASTAIDTINAATERVIIDMVQENTDEDQAAQLRTAESAKGQMAINTEVRNYLSLLNSRVDRELYITKLSLKYNINLADVDLSANKIDTPEATLERVLIILKTAFNERYNLAYYENKGGKYYIHVWDKKENQDMIIDPQSAESILTTLSFGIGSGSDWINSIIPECAHLQEGAPKSQVTGEFLPLAHEKVKKANASFILKTMMEKAMPDITEASKLHSYTQGIYHKTLPDKIAAANIFYFVNGCKAFKGMPDEAGLLQWSEVGSNVDEKIVLFSKLEESDKWSFVSDTSDFLKASRVDTATTYFKILRILNCWKFTNHEIVVPYLAAFIMSLPIQTAVFDPNLTFITGDAESGKTTLIQYLLGGTSNTSTVDDITILESANYVLEATSAAIFQKFNKTTLTICLDETEESASHTTKSDIDKMGIQRGIYNVPTGGGHRIRGTPDGKTTNSTTIQCPIIMAGINPPKDSTLLTRMMMIHTKKTYGFHNVRTAILSRYGEDEIIDLRQAITLMFLPDLYKIKEFASEFRKELSILGNEVTKSSDRFINTISAGVTILKYLNNKGMVDYPEEYKDLEELFGNNIIAENLYKNILLTYKDSIEAVHNTQGHADLIYTCLYTELIRDAHSKSNKGSRPINIIAAGGSKDNSLNLSDVGIYVDRPLGVIFFDWQRIRFGFLQQNTIYSGYGMPSLIETVTRNPHDYPMTSEAFEIMKGLAGADIRMENCTATKLTFISEEVAAAVQARTEEAVDELHNL